MHPYVNQSTNIYRQSVNQLSNFSISFSLHQYNYSSLFSSLHSLAHSFTWLPIQTCTAHPCMPATQIMPVIMTERVIHILIKQFQKHPYVPLDGRGTSQQCSAPITTLITPPITGNIREDSMQPQMYCRSMKSGHAFPPSCLPVFALLLVATAIVVTTYKWRNNSNHKLRVYL